MLPLLSGLLALGPLSLCLEPLWWRTTRALIYTLVQATTCSKRSSFGVLVGKIKRKVNKVPSICGAILTGEPTWCRQGLRKLHHMIFIAVPNCVLTPRYGFNAAATNSIGRYAVSSAIDVIDQDEKAKCTNFDKRVDKRHSKNKQNETTSSSRPSCRSKIHAGQTHL